MPDNKENLESKLEDDEKLNLRNEFKKRRKYAIISLFATTGFVYLLQPKFISQIDGQGHAGMVAGVIVGVSSVIFNGFEAYLIYKEYRNLHKQD